jgi:hypothetical protein
MDQLPNLRLSRQTNPPLNHPLSPAHCRLASRLKTPAVSHLASHHLNHLSSPRRSRLVSPAVCLLTSFLSMMYLPTLVNIHLQAILQHLV